MEKNEKKAVIFCSSSNKIDPAYSEAARSVVRGLAAAGYVIVSGGTTKGLMGVVSEEAERAGAKHIGVIPRFFAEFHYPGKMETEWTDTMSERKVKLREGTAAAIILPGGLGTMDEFFETHVLAKLGQYDGRIMILNIKGFYDPLMAMLKDFVKEGTAAESDLGLLEVYDNAADLIAKL